MRCLRRLRRSRRRRGRRARTARLAAPGPGGLRHRRVRRPGLPQRSGIKDMSPKRSRKPTLTRRLPGSSAIGHTRYSTAGGSFLRNGQPMFADLLAGGIAIAHNGNPDQLPDHARTVGRGRRDLPVDLRLRGHSAPYRAFAEKPGGGEVHRRLATGRRRIRAGGADQQEADRRSRSSGHPPARPGRSQRPARCSPRKPGR